MSNETRKLRERHPISYKEVDTDDSEENEFFDSSSVIMANAITDELSQQIQNLQSQLQQLRTSQEPQPNLQKMHIPSFNERNPHLWFAQIERSFTMCNITSDSDMFDLISVRLVDNILLSVEDIITNPPEHNKYTTLKERLISLYAESAESKLRRLLQGGETNDMKPTAVLAHMKRLAPGKGNESIIRTLFLGQMPETMRPFLSAWEEEDLEKLAKTADKMFEANINNNTNSFSYQSTMALSVDAISPRMSPSEICQTLRELSDKVDKLQREVSKISQQSQRYRSTSRSRSLTPQNAVQHKLCFYHRKFGSAALKCLPDCSFSKSEN